MTKQIDTHTKVLKDMLGLMSTLFTEVKEHNTRLRELEKRWGIEIMEDRGDDSGLYEGEKNNEEPE